MNADTQVAAFESDGAYVDLAVEIFSLLADATRVGIILALRETEQSVNTLAETVGKSPAAVSQHLAKLRLGRIVRARHEANRVYYSLVDEHARTLVTQAVYQAQHALGEQAAHHPDAP